jgi:DNA invertase Pin-like site-specific DNA recombinase
MKSATKVAIYCRVSTNEQHVETQIASIQKFCEAQGWSIVETYQDVGVSGAQDSRPALDKLKKDCVKGKFKAVVVFKFDRMARSVGHLLECLELFRKHGIDFISISEGIDTSTAVGRMVFTFLGAIAEFERSLIRERVTAGIARAKSEGVKLGRPRRGFDFAEAMRLKNSGLGYKQIARQLGVPRSSLHRYLRTLCPLSQKPVS